MAISRCIFGRMRKRRRRRREEGGGSSGRGRGVGMVDGWRKRSWGGREEEL
jgi:hypothetical protein